MTYRVVTREPRGGTDQPVTAFVQTQAELDALGLRAELPAELISKGPLAVVSLGQQPTAAHSVELKSVIRGESGDEATVRWLHRTDGPPADVICWPVAVIQLPPEIRRCRFEQL